MPTTSTNAPPAAPSPPSPSAATPANSPTKRARLNSKAACWPRLRNNRRAQRNNGDIATVRAIDPQGSSVLVEKDDGSQQMLDLSRLADRHLRHGWVRTIHAAQGATADRVMAHMESFRANTVDAASAYVAISRARSHAAIYTDNRARLTDALGLRDGSQVGAIDEAMTRQKGKTITMPVWDLEASL